MVEKTLTQTFQTVESQRLHQIVASQALEGLVTPPDEEKMLTHLGTGTISFANYEQWAKRAYVGGS